MPETADTQILTPEIIAMLQKTADLHKYSYGHAHILAGPSGRGGAARLAARGALRVGAGLVTLGCGPDALVENAAQMNAVMVRIVDGPSGLARLLETEKIAALCLGPGLGLNENTIEMVAVALRAHTKCVIDADGLSIFENNEERLFSLLHEDVVLTPHGGEFRRLFPDIARALEGGAEGATVSKAEAARLAAARAGCVVLLKGADTVIATANGDVSVCSARGNRAAPWLATAGSGDVLAGFIAGLMARGFSPAQSATTAAALHLECARAFGPGLIAEDLPDALPGVFRGLGL